MGMSPFSSQDAMAGMDGAKALTNLKSFLPLALEESKGNHFDINLPDLPCSSGH